MINGNSWAGRKKAPSTSLSIPTKGEETLKPKKLREMNLDRLPDFLNTDKRPLVNPLQRHWEMQMTKEKTLMHALGRQILPQATEQKELHEHQGTKVLLNVQVQGEGLTMQ